MPKCWFCKREYEEYVPDDDLFPVCPECLWDGSEANPRNSPSRTLGDTEA